MAPFRFFCAVVLAPLVVPVVYVAILGALTGGNPQIAEPLLPGQVAAITVFSYVLTFVVAGPVWAMIRHRPLTYQTSAVAGLVLGTLAAFFFVMKGFPPGLFALTGALGGVLEAVTFRAIIGSRTEAR
ncbi:MAG: hypothetical protein OEW19_09360 [Acidobacteriota bacterium]|nr:hypothetical protein [Acidobacteriota bacterium]